MTPTKVPALEVPEGRHNVAHRGNGGVEGTIVHSPEGAAHMVALCRPFGAWPYVLTPTHRSRGGLQSFVPDGTGQDDESASLVLLERFLGRLAHAGIATLIFSFTGSETNFGSLGIASPSLRKLSR